MTADGANVLIAKQLGSKRAFAFHCRKNLRAADIVPRSCYDCCVVVKFLYHCDSFCELLLGKLLRAAENDCFRALYLIFVELAEVLHIHLDFRRVSYSCCAVELDFIAADIKHCLDNIGKLSYTRRLDENSVGAELLENLRQRLSEITDKRAADTALIHLGDLNARVLHKAAVNADFTELVFDKNELFAVIALFEKLLYERCFTRSEKARKYIYLCHCYIYLFSYYAPFLGSKLYFTTLYQYSQGKNSIL